MTRALTRARSRTKEVVESLSMGGHGGLNILPHKSWNVYGTKQRDRVRRDELAHAARLAEERASALEDERDGRLRALRATASKRDDDGGSRHVNLFAEEEAAAARDFARGMNASSKVRPNDESHAGEDEGLRFGGRDVAGRESAPWYANALRDGAGTGTSYESLPARVRREKEDENKLRKLSSSSSARAKALAAPSKRQSSESADERSTKKSKKDKKRSKRSRVDDAEDRKLHLQRLEREMRDADRARALVRFPERRG